MIDSTPDLIFVIDKQRRLQMVNKAFASRNELGTSFFRGKTPLEIGIAKEIVLGDPARGIPGLWAEEDQVIATGEPLYIPERVISINGVEEVVSMARVPLKDEAGIITGILCYVHDITDLKRSQEELSKKDILLRALAHATYELISADNPQCAILKVIASLGKKIQLDRVNVYCNTEEATGKFFHQLASWDGSTDKLEYRSPAMQHMPASIMPFAMEVLGRNEIYSRATDDLEDLPLYNLMKERKVRSLASLPIFVAGRFWGFVSFNDCQRDRKWSDAEISILQSFSATLGAVIERNEITEELVRAKEVAEAADKAKSEFLATISHELLTPMNAIIGFNDLVLTMELPPVQRDFLEKGRKSAYNLLRLINDILDISNIETGRLQLDYSAFKLSTLVEDAVESMAIGAFEKKLEMVCRIDPRLPESVLGDARRIKQALVNLLDNAIKFTEKGEIMVDVRLGEIRAQEDNRKFGRVFIEINDTGIGMAPDILARIFQSFTQGDSSATRKYGGSGLGLSITKGLAELMGGQLSVTSEPGRGSVFTLSLSLEIMKDAAGSLQAPLTRFQKVLVAPNLNLDRPDVNCPAGNAKALVVEDDPFGLLLITEVLTRMGMQVIQASTVVAVLDALSRERPAIVFTSTHIAEISGYDVIRMIRNMPYPVGNTPIVAVTGDDEEEEKRNCRQAGMNSFISKPVQLKAIESVVRLYVN